MRGFVVAAVALAGLLFAATPVSERAEFVLLDARIAFLHQFVPRAAPDDIIIVGVDEESLRRIPEPPALWHEPLGRVLLAIAAAKPRAIGLDLALPERSYELIRPGLDRALALGIAAARQNAELVAALQVDPRTRAARAIHAPFLALLGEERLALGLLARDADGRVRRFSLAIPTQDGTFPSFAGRLCRALSRGCRDGLIDFAFGAPFRLVTFHDILVARDPQYLERLFRGRIVLLGEVQRHTQRFEVPVNLAGWEPPGPDTPGVVIQAASLRTALHGEPPAPAGKPLLILLVSLAALLAFARDSRLAFVTFLVASAFLFAVATAALHRGLVLELAPALVTLALAWAAGAFAAVRRRRA